METIKNIVSVMIFALFNLCLVFYGGVMCEVATALYEKKVVPQQCMFFLVGAGVLLVFCAFHNVVRYMEKSRIEQLAEQLTQTFIDMKVSEAKAKAKEPIA